MGKKKRLQMQRKLRKSSVAHRREQGRPKHQPGRRRQKAPSTDQPLPVNIDELERQHAAWLARRGHAYISLAEMARLWNRTPEQIIRWEQIVNETGD